MPQKYRWKLQYNLGFLYTKLLLLIRHIQGPDNKTDFSMFSLILSALLKGIWENGYWHQENKLPISKLNQTIKKSLMQMSKSIMDSGLANPL